MRKDCRVRQASGNLIRGAGQDSCSGVLSLPVESPVCTCGHGRWCSGRRNEGDGSERTQGDKATRIRTRHRQGALSKKLRATTDRLERKKDYPRAVGEKIPVNNGSSSGSPVRSSACRIAKRHERHQTPAPSCLDATMGTGLPPSQVLPDANQDTVPTND